MQPSRNRVKTVYQVDFKIHTYLSFLPDDEVPGSSVSTPIDVLAQTSSYEGNTTSPDAANNQTDNDNGQIFIN